MAVKYIGRALLIAALSWTATGCTFDNNDNSNPGMPPVVAQTYTVAVTEVGITNKESGEKVIVDGVPVQGGVLTVE
jgi:hypothetical protein